jgi:ABC-type siderophore export system fused ATPase/permease subunit
LRARRTSINESSKKEGDYLIHVVLTFVSVVLLLAVVAIIKERRLRLALQQILIRLIERWRSNANTHTTRPVDRRDAIDDNDRVRQE